MGPAALIGRENELSRVEQFLEGAPGRLLMFNTLTMGTMQPLSVGPHVVRTYWVFNAMHCDGLGDVLLVNCIPSGETLFSRIPFEVTAERT